MNRIFRTIWSIATHSWQAVPETAKSAGKKSKSSSGGGVASVVLGLMLVGGVGAQSPPPAQQLPTGASVVRGNATISQTATAQAAAMTVTQTSQRAVVNWDSFNLGQSSTINFVQPNAQAAILNRVNDGNPSQIFGQMTSNGQVFLTNANGVYFSPTSSVDVGALTATTHRISDDAFMSGNYAFERNGATGKVINEGRLSSSLGGYIALLAPEVQNSGVVVARAGTVAMAAGELITLRVNGVGGLAGLTTTPSTMASLIENKQAVQAPDGQIILSAVALNKIQAGVIKNSGSLEANSLVSKGGKIFLEGDEISLASTSKIEAKGATGGGSVLVGGDWQGSAEMRQATKVTMAQGAVIDASATVSGDGGKVVLWSDVNNPESTTTVDGAIYARAGSQSGNGGKIETSGHHLYVDLASGDAQAPQGNAGEWLFDPYNVTVTSATANGSFNSSGSTDTWAGSANASTILNTTIQSRLNTGTNVVITTAGAGTDAGNIAINSNIITGAMTSDATLTFKAEKNITLATGVAIDATQNSNTKKLHVVLQSNTAGGTDGSVALASGSAIKSNGGEIFIGGGSATTTSVAGNSVPSGNALSSASAGITITTATLDAGGGDINLKGQSGDLTNGVGVLLTGGSTVSGGNVNLFGVGGAPVGGSLATTTSTNTITATSGNAVIQGSLFSTTANNYTVSATAGNVTINSPQAWKSDTLTLSAGQNIDINQALDASQGGSLTVRFGQASSDGSGSSYNVSAGSSILIPLPTGSGTKFRWKKGSTGVDNELVLNNGYLAFGAGTAGLATALNQSAISANGQLNQPNFFDQSPDGTGRKLWYKLTYSSNPLTFQIGAGTGGTNWTGDSAFVSAISTGVAYLDIGQYLPGAGTGPGAGVKGAGVIKSIAPISLNGATANFINRFSLGASDAYVRTDSSITVTSGSLTNVGLWIGTQDDYVGATGDASFKTVGTVGSSGFIANTQTGQFANALRVDENVTNGASVLFYSIDASANATFSGCCAFTNATSINPANQIAKTASVTDGSYALYTGLGNISTGTNKGFTWFYAAAPSTQVNAVAQKVASTLTSYSFPAGQNLSVTYSGSAFNLSDLWTSMSLNQGNNNFLTLYPNASNASYYSFTYNGNSISQLTNAGTYRLGITLSPDIANNYLLSSSYAPTLTINPAQLTISGSIASNKVYDGTTTGAVTAGVLSGLIGAQTVGVTGTGTFSSANVGAWSVTPTYTLSNGANGGLASNYIVVNAPTLSASISPANLVLTGTKVYDGTTLVSGSTLSAKGVGTQTFSITGSGNDIASAYPQTNSALTSLSGLSLGTGANGAIASNYNALSLVGSTYSITPKPLTVIGTTVTSKIYDGTLTASLTGGSLVGVIGGDLVTLGQSGVFATSAAGIGKAVTATDVISGASASYYILTQPVGLTGTITPKALSVIGTTVASKPYDGTTVASLSGGTLSGVVSGDTVTLTQVGSFASANAGASVVVTASDSLGGTSATNYSLIQPTGLTGVITPKVLTVTGTTVSSKTYDGTANATLSGGSLSGVVSGESLTLSQSGLFASPNAGAGIAVSATDSISGATASNYVLTQPTGLIGTISPKSLSISGLVVSNKTYDGFSNAVVTNWGQVSTGIANESLTLTHGSATFADASAGTNKTVTASGYALADGPNNTLAKNYVLTSSSTTAVATINQAPLSVIANNDAKFITQLDAGNFAGVSYSGFVNGETATVVTGTPSVSRSNSTQNGPGIYSGVLVPNTSGLTASNYSFVPRNGDYTIVPANQLLIRATSQPVTYGTSVTYQISSAQYLTTNGGVNTIVDLTSNVTSTGNNRFQIVDGVGGSAAFDIVPSAASTSTSGNVNVGAYQLASAGAATTNANNFSNTISLVGAQTVLAKTVSVQSINGVTKAYDGTTDLVGFSVGLNGTISGDLVSASGLGSYASKDAGTNLSYAVNNFSLTGADKNNYQLTAATPFSGTDGVITKAHLTVAANAATKIYGDANPTLTSTISGFVNGETLATSGVTGTSTATTTATPATGVGTAVISAGVGTLSASNYDFNQLVDSTLTIAQRPINIVANSATKIYGDTNPALTYVAEVATDGRGLVVGDTFTGGLNTSATATSSVGSYNITSSLANSNYAMTFNSANLVVTPKPITLTNNTVTPTYDGVTTYASLASNAGFTTNTALVGSDAISAVTQTLSNSGGALVGSKVAQAGTFTATPSTAVLSVGDANNYSFNYVSSTNTVAKANLSITATPNLSGNVYNGQTFTAGYTTTALGNDGSGITVTGLASGINAGTYTSALSATGSVLSNYNAPTFTNANLVISPRAIGLSANAAQKTYGNLDPTWSISISSGTLAALDSVTDVAGVLSRTAGENVGSYTLALGAGVKAPNYTISFTPNTLTINPRAISLAASALSKTYGNLDPTLTASITAGSLGSASVTDTLADVTGVLTRTSGEDVGSYNVAMGSGAKASNYTISYTPNTLTINPRAISLAASALSKTYGNLDPALTASITAGSLGSASVTDTLADVTGVLTRTSGEDVGSYNVAMGSGAKASNYTISYTPNTLTINPRAISIAATAQNKTYGNLDPTLTASITAGSLGSASVSDTLADVTGLITRTSGEDVGSYNVALGNGAKASNYTINYTPNTLTIDPRPITLAANTQHKVYGNLDPALTASITAGSLASASVTDTLADVTGVLTRTSGENVGSYNVALGTGAKASNYTITFASNNQAITIDPKPLSLTGQMNFTGQSVLDTTRTGTTLAATNLVGSDVVSITGTAGLAAPGAGNQALTNFSNLHLSNNNYTLTGADGTVKVIPTQSIDVGVLLSSEVSTLLNSQLSGLTGNQMGKFSVAQLQVFTGQQMGSLSATQLSGFNAAQISSLSEVQLQGLTPAQVTLLTPAQIAGLKPNQVAVLTSNAAAPLSFQQVYSLAPAQIAAMRPAQLARMTAAEVGALHDDQLKSLTLEQLAAISPKSFSALAPEQIMAMSVAQVASLAPAQLAGLTPIQVASLQPHQIDALSATQLAAMGIYPNLSGYEAPIPVMTAVASNVPPVASMTGIEIRGLSANQLNSLPKDQVANLNPAQVQALTTTQLSQMSSEQAGNLSKSQLSVMSQTQLEALPVRTTVETPPQNGVLSIAFLQGPEAKPVMKGVVFEQSADAISLKATSVPIVPTAVDKVINNDQLTPFKVTTSGGDVVEFQGGLVNNRIVIVAASSEAKSVVRDKTNLVLAAAVSSLGKDSRIVLVQIDGVIIDLR